MDKRFIEVSFPIKEVSQESVREKNIRHGHISTLHIWWARRPLASSRATSYAALIPTPKDDTEWEKKRQFIIELSKWENSLNPYLIERARKEILEANGGKPVKVLDPFAGGGSIPLETLRLGCETYAGEYNPVAVLILKAVLEYPQKYGKPREGKEGWFEIKKNPLLEDVKKWGNRVLEEAKKEIGKFYPNEEDGSIPVGYIWARTIPCQNPSCGAEIPLMRQYWLANKKKTGRKIALRPFVDDGKVKFEIVGQGKDFPEDFDPSRGTVSKAIAECLVYHSRIDDRTVRKLFQEGKSGQRMVAVVLHHPKKGGKFYRIANEKDLEVFNEAEKYLEEKRAKLMEKWEVDPIPDEPLPPKKTLGFSVQRYGLLKWGDLFNSRQKLALITFVEKIRQAYEKMLAEGMNEEYAKAVVSYLALVTSRMTDFESVLGAWHPQWEFSTHAFARQALQMTWDYSELNPFSPILSGTFESMFRQVLRPLEYLCQGIGSNFTQAEVSQFSATSLPYPDNYFDAVFTDPPYYDNVPYSYLSDFFYVWLKRAIGDLYPELFSTPLTPKTKEIVAYTLNRTRKEAKAYFEENLKKSFQEIYRVLKPNGIATIVYTHKSTSGWEVLINSLLDSGLVITASWPIRTEMEKRLRARESAALASSIYFVARKAKREEIGWFSKVKEEIKQHLNQKLERLWEEGISGADFFIAGIGSAIEIFGKYEKVMNYEGNVIRADKLLDFVRDIVTDYTLRQIFHEEIAGQLSPLTKFYLLWRCYYQDKKAHFDDARKLAQSANVELTKEWNKRFIKKEGEFIRVLGPHERNLSELERSTELIDVLHKVLILWKEDRREEMKKVLVDSGWGTKDVFYKVAQAISSLRTRERRWLEGFLTGKENLISETKLKPYQRRLL